MAGKAQRTTHRNRTRTKLYRGRRDGEIPMTEPTNVPPIALRDLFAAVALHAMIVANKTALTSEAAYQYADDMLAARASEARIWDEPIDHARA